MTGLRAAEATSWAATQGSTMIEQETIEALATEVFREAPPARTRLPNAPMTRTPAFHLLPPTIIPRAREGTEPNHRGQPSWLLHQRRGPLLHRGRSADHNVPIEQARLRRGRVFRDGLERAGVFPPLGFGTTRGEEGHSHRRNGGGGEDGDGGVATRAGVVVGVEVTRRGATHGELILPQ
jgi:hypothetical protein